MDGYQSDELFESPLQTSCSSSESGDFEPEAGTSRDKHIEFMRIAFRAKQPQRLDSARIKTNSAKPFSMFLTPSRPHSSMRQENISTASKRIPGTTRRTPGSAGRTSKSARPAKDRSHEMSAGGKHRSSPLQEHALAEVLNGLTGQLKSCELFRQQEKCMESIEKQLQSASSSGSSSSESQRLKEKVPLGVRVSDRHLYATCKFMSLYYAG